MSLLEGFFSKPRKANNRATSACPIPDTLPNGKSTFVLLMAASKGGTGKSTLCMHLAALDVAAMHASIAVADIMLTPAQPSPLDLQATAPIRRLWRANNTPAVLILNGVTSESGARARFYMRRYADIGHVLPSVVSRRVQYADAIAVGMGVSEYLPGGDGDLEIRRLLRAIFQRAEVKDPS